MTIIHTVFSAFSIVTRCLALLLGLTLTSACSTGDNTVKLPSVNYNSRVNIIVIHHTAEGFESSVNILTKPSSNPVSSHYLIPETKGESLDPDSLKVFKLVPETGRAWHAGRSYWRKKVGLNDQSIGIELVNESYCHNYNAIDYDITNTNPAESLCFYPDFSEPQIVLLLDLLKGIVKRHPDIKPFNIIGHSDIAPSRKVDPGPRFPWQKLYQFGFGAWYDDETLIKYWERFIEEPIPLIKLQEALHVYGYNIEETGELDKQTRQVLRAFQMHFSPSKVTHEPTLESTAILFALIEKYFPSELGKLLPAKPQLQDCFNMNESNP